MYIDKVCTMWNISKCTRSNKEWKQKVKTWKRLETQSQNL